MDDAGEVYQIDCVDLMPPGNEGQLAIGNIEVPTTAVVGNTRIRIIGSADGLPLDPCGDYFYAQAEDYTIVVRNTPLPVCVIECPEDMIVEIPVGQTGTIVDYPMLFECDNIGGVVLELVEGLSSGSEFPVGVTTVIYNLEYEGEIINTCEFTTTVDAVLGTENLVVETFIIYPNPVIDLLNISSTETINNIQIFDISGKKVFTTSPHNKMTQLDLSTIVPGIYLVKLIAEDSVRIVKMIKK